MNYDKESLLNRGVINDTVIALKDVERNVIASDTQRFLAAGGQIRQFGVNERAEFDGAAMYRNYPAQADNLASSDHGIPFAAQFLGMSQSNLKRMMLAGNGPVHHVEVRGTKNYYRFKMANLVAFRQQREAARKC